jgi:hypothetical protein
VSNTYVWEFSLLNPVDSFEEFLIESKPSLTPNVSNIFELKYWIIAGCVNKHIKFGGFKKPGRYRLVVKRSGTEVHSKLTLFV